MWRNISWSHPKWGSPRSMWGCISLKEKLPQRRLQWCVHVIRADENSLAQVDLNIEVVGKCQNDRSKQRWLYTLGGVLRTVWRPLTKQISALDQTGSTRLLTRAKDEEDLLKDSVKIHIEHWWLVIMTEIFVDTRVYFPVLAISGRKAETLTLRYIGKMRR